MFKKLKSLGGGGKGRSKFRLDVTVAALEGLPEQYDKCRVVWARQVGQMAASADRAPLAGRRHRGGAPRHGRRARAHGVLRASQSTSEHRRTCGAACRPRSP